MTSSPPPPSRVRAAALSAFLAATLVSGQAPGIPQIVPQWGVPSISTVTLPAGRIGAGAFFNASGIVITGGASSSTATTLAAPSFFPSGACRGARERRGARG